MNALLAERNNPYKHINQSETLDDENTREIPMEFFKSSVSFLYSEPPQENISSRVGVKLYLLTKQDGGKLIFNGLFIGGYVDTPLVDNQISYKLNDLDEHKAVLSADKAYPNSNLFSSNQYVGAVDNWQ